MSLGGRSAATHLKSGQNVQIRLLRNTTDKFRYPKKMANGLTRFLGPIHLTTSQLKSKLVSKSEYNSEFTTENQPLTP